MKLTVPRLVLYLAMTFVAGCQAISPAGYAVVFPFYASIPEAQAVAAGQFGSLPIELSVESDIELVGAVDCNSTVAKVLSRTGRQGWIPVNDLPTRLQISGICATETGKGSLVKSNLGKPPSVN